MQNTRKPSIVEDPCTAVYKLGRTLGEGAFSVVKMATHKLDKSIWAAKIINQDALSAGDKESLHNEVRILTKLHHANIVMCKEVFDTPKHMYIVMEFMSGGELFDRIITKEHYGEKEAVSITRQIIAAVKHCHDNNVVHRDLKPENLLFQNTQDDAPLKLADFGLALLLKPNENGHAACGTPGYVAPEVLAVKTKNNKEGYGKEVDMWSVGVIVYILLCGFPPFYHESNTKLFELIQRAEYKFPSPYWDDVSETAKDFIRKLLVLNPQERLSAPQALQHPWIVEPNTSSKELVHFKEQMSNFNAKQRMRKAIRAVQFINRMSRAVSETNSKNTSRSSSLTASMQGGANAAAAAVAASAAAATVAAAAEIISKCSDVVIEPDSSAVTTATNTVESTAPVTKTTATSSNTGHDNSEIHDANNPDEGSLSRSYNTGCMVDETREGSKSASTVVPKEGEAGGNKGCSPSKGTITPTKGTISPSNTKDTNAAAGTNTVKKEGAASKESVKKSAVKPKQ